jgi:hypothetical protein
VKPVTIVGILLLVLGLAVFIVPIPHREQHGVQIGDAKIGVQTESSAKLPPAVGIVLLTGGVVALVLGARKSWAKSSTQSARSFRAKKAVLLKHPDYIHWPVSNLKSAFAVQDSPCEIGTHAGIPCKNLTGPSLGMRIEFFHFPESGLRYAPTSVSSRVSSGKQWYWILQPAKLKQGYFLIEFACSLWRNL